MKIKRPTLIIDRRKVLANIQRMADKAGKSHVRFRPHFKTHQSAQVGDWFRLFGVTAITVSSVEMASYFAQHGWQDIAIAFPVNPLEIDEINDLARRIVLHLLVESAEIVRFLDRELKHQVNVWLKIDTGYKRTGIAWDNTTEIALVIGAIEESPVLSFKGILTHAGHAYQAGAPAEIKRIHQDTLVKMNDTRNRLKPGRSAGIEISIGDTPTCSVADDFGCVDEIRCGNFVFYDVMQLFLGSCRQEDIAAAAACPVVAKHAERTELVIYGGAVHLSKERVKDPAGREIYGLLAVRSGDSWGVLEESAYVSSLSQEHGIIKAGPAFFNRTQVGDIVMVLPVHACLAADLLKHNRLVVN
ncbi:MAG: alanine racemase [Candidatus Aminicenantes bacterium]|nr:alanine racemase [Candidatus Aminicenantes bacterium]